MVGVFIKKQYKNDVQRFQREQQSNVVAELQAQMPLILHVGSSFRHVRTTGNDTGFMTSSGVLAHTSTMETLAK